MNTRNINKDLELKTQAAVILDATIKTLSQLDVVQLMKLFDELTDKQLERIESAASVVMKERHIIVDQDGFATSKL